MSSPKQLWIGRCLQFIVDVRKDRCGPFDKYIIQDLRSEKIPIRRAIQMCVSICLPYSFADVSLPSRNNSSDWIPPAGKVTSLQVHGDC